MTARRFLAAVGRFKWLILLITAVGTGIGIVAARYIDPIYTAQATVWMHSGGEDEEQGPIRSGELLSSNAWADLLESYEVLEPVVLERRLHIEAVRGDAEAIAGLSLKGRFTTGTYRLAVDSTRREFRLLAADGRVLDRGAPGDSLGEALGLAWTPAAENLSPGEFEFRIRPPREVARALRDQLSTQMADGGSFLTIAIDGSDPEWIAGIVNSAVERFVDVAGDLKRARLDELTDILARQLAIARENLETAERRLEDFRVNTITMPSERAVPVAAGLEVTRDPVFSSFFEMKLEEDRLERDARSIERALAEARDSAFPVAALEVIPAVRESSELMRALEELTTKRAELRALRYRYTDRHPPVQTLREEIRTLEESIVPRLARGLVRELDQRRTTLGQRISSASAELREVPTRAIEEARLQRRVQIAEELYTMLQSRYEEARIAAASSIPDLRVLDRATVPQAPVKNTRPQVIAMAIVGSFLLSLLLALLLDRMDSRLNYPEQVTDEIGLTILGAVPYIASRGREIDPDTTGQVIEAFRTIRLAVHHAYGAAGPLVFTVSSPGIGDGKSLVATNLAIAFADLGASTLLIDGDARRGSLHRFLGAARKPGLTDHLDGSASQREIVRDARQWLDMIPCGTRSGTAPELLSSPAMRELLGDARSNYDVVIVDSPPLSAGVDPFVLGSLTGHLLMVLRTGATNRELTAAKLEMIERLPVRVLGAVLNAVPPKGMHRYQKYYSYMPDYAVEVEADDASGQRLALQSA